MPDDVLAAAQDAGAASQDAGAAASAASAASAAPATSQGGAEKGGADAQTSAAGAGASDDDLSVFSFSEADAEAGADDAQEASAAGDGEQDAGAARDAVAEGFALDAQSGIPEGLHDGLGKLASKHHIDGKAASAYLADAMAFAREQEVAANRVLSAQLREEWGSQFDAKVTANKQFLARLAKDSGIPMEAMQVFASPNGMRVAECLRSYVGESGKLAGKVAHAPRLSPQDQLDAIYNSPDDYEALVNPSNPRYHEVNNRVNQLLGISPSR